MLTNSVVHKRFLSFIEKTYHSDDIVNSSIKKDKLHQIIYNYQQQNDLRKQLLVIKNLGLFLNLFTINSIIFCFLFSFKLQIIVLNIEANV
jgi:hypothetical protein